MSFPFAFHEHTLGHILEHRAFTVFFSHGRCEDLALAQAFPDYNLSFLRQTHSDIVIEAPFRENISGERPEGDAQVTHQRKLALCVRTADCLPVMLYNSESGEIAAIHAGWRGIENEIIRKTCTRMAKNASPSEIYAWVGPHISSGSFEVENDVARRLETCFDAVRGCSELQGVSLPHADTEKKYIDLFAIAKAQLGASGVSLSRISSLGIDTMTSSEHASYRRSGPSAGRQISFIAIK